MQNDYVSVAKTHASLLVESLKEQGILLQKSQALEIISNLHSRTDWNRLRARLTRLGHSKAAHGAVADQPAKAFFLFGEEGSGKTDALKTLFEIEFVDGETAPIMISVAGNGHITDGGQDEFFKKCERITLMYDEDGITDVDKKNRSAPINMSGGLLVNLVSTVKGSRQGAGNALAQFLIGYESYILISGLRKFGSLLIDDYDQIEKSERLEVGLAASKFASSGKHFRRLVFAAKNVINKGDCCPPGMDFMFYVADNHPNIFGYDNKYVAHSGGRTWMSECLSDDQIVKDVYMRSREKSKHNGHSNGDSRVLYLPAKSLWFNDLRASLVS